MHRLLLALALLAFAARADNVQVFSSPGSANTNTTIALARTWQANTNYVWCKNGESNSGIPNFTGGCTGISTTGVGAVTFLGTIGAGGSNGTLSQNNIWVISTGSVTLVEAGGVNSTSLSWSPALTAGGLLSVNGTTTRLWVALSQQGVATNNLLVGLAPAMTPTAYAFRFVAVGYDSTVNGGRWVCCAGNGTSYSCSDSGVAFGVGSWHNVSVAYPATGTGAAGDVTCTADIVGYAYPTQPAPAVAWKLLASSGTTPAQTFYAAAPHITYTALTGVGTPYYFTWFAMETR